jgi:aminomethyltransferase
MNAAAFRATPFQPATRARNRTTWWYGWGGYAVPDVYVDPWAELAAMRNGVTMNEMSPIPKVRIAGPDAARCVDYLITRDVSKMPADAAWYTPWCNDDGRVVSDGIVLRWSDDEFLLSGDRSTGFFRSRCDRFDVSIDDVTDDWGILALQGPRSRAVLEAVTGEAWDGLRFGRVRTTRIAGADLRVARQGFTGEPGYELWVPRAAGAASWEAVAASGASFDIQPAGEYAIDIARVEAGLILVSADYTGAGPDQKSADVVVDAAAHITPYELGIGHCVSLDKAADFIGRDALRAEQAAGPRRAMFGIELDVAELARLALDRGRAPEISPRVRWDRLAVFAAGTQVGAATSITWSPTTRRMIGFACLDRNHSAPGTELQIDWADFWGAPLGRVSARVVPVPFIPLRRGD